MKRKSDSMLPYVVVATLVAVPALTGFIHALRSGLGVAGAPVVAKQGTPAQVAHSALPARR